MELSNIVAQMPLVKPEPYFLGEAGKRLRWGVMVRTSSDTVTP